MRVSSELVSPRPHHQRELSGPTLRVKRGLEAPVRVSVHAIVKPCVFVHIKVKFSKSSARGCLPPSHHLRRAARGARAARGERPRPCDRAPARSSLADRFRFLRIRSAEVDIFSTRPAEVDKKRHMASHVMLSNHAPCV